MPPRRVSDWLARPWLDWVIGVVAAWAVTQVDTGSPIPFIRDLGMDQRLTLYQSLAGIAAALLGFFVATVSILLTLMDSTRPRMQRALAGGNSSEIQSYFFAGIYASAVGVALLLVFVWVDNRETPPPVIEAGVVAIALILGLSTARIIWVLRKVIKLAAKDQQDE